MGTRSKFGQDFNAILTPHETARAVQDGATGNRQERRIACAILERSKRAARKYKAVWNEGRKCWVKGRTKPV